MAELAGLVVFRNTAIENNGYRAPADDADERRNCTAEYFRSREMAERAAAKRAQSLAARHIHQELAQHYAELANRAG